MKSHLVSRGSRATTHMIENQRGTTNNRLLLALLVLVGNDIILSPCRQVTGLAIDKSTGQQSTERRSQQEEVPPKLPQAARYIAELNVRDQRRPIWALAHMVNSIKELDYRLGTGANAVEVDVTFSREGVPLFTYHGPPCDCLRHCHQQEDFNEYLSYVREIAIDESEGVGKNLTILFLDLKLDYLDTRGKAKAGVELAKSILENLYVDSETNKLLMELKKSHHSAGNETSGQPNANRRSETPLRLIVSVNHVGDVELINNFLHHLEVNNATHLLKRIGFDVGMNDDIRLIESMWRRFGNSLNLWQGDGYTNCFSPFYNLERLSRAIVKRDSSAGYPSKVYHWTIDLHDRMRESLTMGVDAVMTNHPERLVAVLQEPELAHDCRLATRDDDPFGKVVLKAGARSSESARYQRSTGPSAGGFFGSFMDVIASWLAYIKEIPFLSLPTTSRFLPKSKRQKSSVMVVLANAPKRGQPEYRVDSSAGNETSRNVSDATDQILVGQKSNETSSEPPPYEGPKWYTSLISNILVSVLKIVLPVS